MPRASNPEALPLARLILFAALFAAAEMAVTLLPGRFFAWGRAEALLFLAFRPWLLLIAATLIARFDLGSRLTFYVTALMIATASEALLLLGLGAPDPWPQLLRGLLASAALLLVVDLSLRLARDIFGRLGPPVAALLLALLFVSPFGLRGYERLIFADEGRGTAAERPDLMVMTGLPIIWGEKGAFDPASRPAASYEALRREFVLRPLDYLDRETLAKGRLLLLAQPRALAPTELAALDQWVRGGGRALILTDPLLAWPSELPLGDIRRPPPLGLLAPLLNHWGIALEPGGAGAAYARDYRWNGETFRLFMDRPGRFAGGGDACRIGPEPWMARCRVGEGRAMLIADADLLHDRLWAPLGARRHQRDADNPLLVAQWLDSLAGIERERVAGRVQWLSPDADRAKAIPLALLPLLAGFATALILRGRHVR